MTSVPAASTSSTHRPSPKMEMAFLLEAKPGEESSAPGTPPLPHYVAPLNEKFAPRPPDVPDDYILFGLRRGSVVEEIRWMPPGAPPPRVSDFPDALMPAINQILLRIYNENPHAIVNGMTSSAFRQFQAQQARLEAGELSPLEAQSFLDTRGRMIDFFTNPPAESAPQAATGGAGSGARTIGPLIAAPAPEPTPAPTPARSTNNFPVEYVPPPPIEFTDPSRKLVDFSLGAGHGDHAPPEETQFNQWPRPGGSTELPLTQRPYTPEPDVEDPQGRPAPLDPSVLGYEPPPPYQDWTGLGAARETQTPEMGRRNFDPEEARKAARRLIDELRERSRRTGENFDTLLGDALDRLNREDPLLAIMLRAQLSYLQINAPARGGAPSEPHDAFDSPLEQLDAKLAELGRAGNPNDVRERVQALVEDIKMGNYPMSHPEARQKAVDILARAAREGLSVDGLNLAFTIALAQSGGNNPVADQIQNAGDFETHAVVGQPDEIADGVQLTLNADGSYTIEVTPARFGEDPTVYYREPGTPPGVWKALETVEAATVSRGTLFRIDNRPEIQIAGPPDDYDAHMSLIDPVQWGQDQPSQDPALLKAQFLARLSQILRMENLTAAPKAEMAREVFREMSARGLSPDDEGFVSQVTGIVQDQLMGSQAERDTFLRTFLDGIFGFDGEDPGSPPR